MQEDCISADQNMQGVQEICGDGLKTMTKPQFMGRISLKSLFGFRILSKG